MKKMTVFRAGVVLFSFFAVFLMHSCQKESIEQATFSTTEENYHEFFDYDRMSKINKNLDESTVIQGEPSSALKKIMSDFIEVEKEKPFVDKLSKEIGFPIWNAYKSFQAADKENVKLIPFSFDNDNLLTAYLITSEKDGDYKYKLVKKSDLESFKSIEDENGLNYEYILTELIGLNNYYYQEVDCSLKDKVKEIIASNYGTEKAQTEEVLADSRACYYVPVTISECISVTQGQTRLCCKCTYKTSYHYLCDEVAVIVENSNNGNNNGGTSTSTRGSWSKQGRLCRNSLQGEEIGESYYFAMVNLDIGFNFSGSSNQPPRNHVIRIKDLCIRVNNKSSYNRQQTRIISAFDQAVYTTEAYLNQMSAINVNVSSSGILAFLKTQIKVSIGSQISGGQVHFNLYQCTGAPPQLGQWNC